MAARRLPDEREAADGMVVAAANAAGLLSDADILAAAGSYGRALSLAVLAFEESVKARTLGAIVASAAHGRQPGFTDDDLREIIYSGHRTRHAAGFFQHLASEFPDVYGKAMRGMTISSAEAAALQDVAWLLASANAGKQSGLYTDFDPDSGSWTAPGNVTSAGFEKVRAVAGDFVAATQRQIDEFTRFRRIPWRGRCRETGGVSVEVAC